MREVDSFSGDWRLIDTAPMDQDVTLLVTDGRGEPYCIPYPCKLTASGWLNWKGNAACGNALAAEALRWPKETVTPRQLHVVLLADFSDAR
jgi:hypothetical protein